LHPSAHPPGHPRLFHQALGRTGTRGGEVVSWPSGIENRPIFHCWQMKKAVGLVGSADFSVRQGDMQQVSSLLQSIARRTTTIQSAARDGAGHPQPAIAIQWISVCALRLQHLMRRKRKQWRDCCLLCLSAFDKLAIAAGLWARASLFYYIDRYVRDTLAIKPP
jgi:hypothetical protein